MACLVTLSDVESWLLALWARLKTQRKKELIINADYLELEDFLKNFTAEEKISLIRQIPMLRVKHCGGLLLLDPSARHASPVHSNIPSSRSFPDVKFNSKADQVLRRLQDTFPFSLIISTMLAKMAKHASGALHISDKATTFLVVDNRAQRASQYSPATESRKRMPLLVVKIATSEAGKKLMLIEIEKLKQFQNSGFVSKFWCDEKVDELASQGAICCHFHPAPSHVDPLVTRWLSLEDITDLATELLRACSFFHSKGFCCFSLKTGHVLYNFHKRDPRDGGDGLCLLGMETLTLCGEALPCEKNAEGLQWQAPEFSGHADSRPVASKPADIFAVGVLLKELLHRDKVVPYRIGTGLCEAERAEMVKNFNADVFNPSMRLFQEHWLIQLVEQMVQVDPLQRPSADEALSFIQGSRPNDIFESLILGSVWIDHIPGRLEPFTGKFLWPVDLKTTVILDEKVKDRLSLYTTVHGAVQTPDKSFTCFYGGRPTEKRNLVFLQYLDLHSHAINDGSLMGWDGRRQCNGIFDHLYYIETMQVLFEKRFLS